MSILSRVVSFLYSLPVIKEFLLILYGYCLKGDNNLTWQTLYKRLILKALKCIFFTASFLFAAVIYEYTINITKIIDLNLSLFSSLLGFGIGIYALLFTVSPDFFQYLHIRKNIAPTAVNADMAYPLAALGLIVVINFILLVFGLGEIGLALAIFCFFYGMSMVFELIAMIYVIANKSVGRRNKKRRFIRK